jgi:hypothetical protein
MQRTSVSNIHASAARAGCTGTGAGLFYPRKGLPQKRWFERYAEDFDTVEINNSFYRLPGGDVRRLAREGAAGLPLRGQGNRFITHMKKLKEGADDGPVPRARNRRSGRFSTSCRRAFGSTWSRLESFLALLPGDVTTVFEFRDASWHTPRPRAARSPRRLLVRPRHAGSATRGWRSGRSPMSASTAQGANMGPLSRRGPALLGRLDVGRRAEAARCGPISTTTSAATRSRTPKRSKPWSRRRAR